MSRAPLTTDRAMLREIVDGLELHTLPDGTAIGVALANAAARLKDSAAKSKVILLVTDGANNAGEIDPASAAAVCKGLGIRVHTIGVGAAGDAPVPVPIRSFNPIAGQHQVQRVLMRVPVDEELLQAIARRTGGRFFIATDSESLRGVFGAIDRLEKTALRVKRYVRYQEAFPPLVWAGLALLLLPLVTTFSQVTAEP